MAYRVLLEEDAERMLPEIDNSVRQRLVKKLVQMQGDEKTARHLRFGAPYFVEEAGGYRIAFALKEKEKQKRVLFIGDHKGYEKWYKTL